MLLRVEAQTGWTELLSALIAGLGMRCAQARATIIAEGTSRATTSRAQNICQIPVFNDSAIEVVHDGKLYYFN